MYNREHYQDVPERILNSLDGYAKRGETLGGFLSAVVENNLFQAIGHGDPESRAALKQIVTYVNCQLPPGCWGSKDKVKAWRASCTTS